MHSKKEVENIVAGPAEKQGPFFMPIRKKEECIYGENAQHT